MVDCEVRLARAYRSLEGLSVGDALGNQGLEHASDRPWTWTDDTAMAIEVVECLSSAKAIHPEELAAAFARRFEKDPGRGYGAGTFSILKGVCRGESWRELAAAVFGGQGSMGNGAAMRAAPIGAYFSDDFERVASEARTSALPTHAHVDGQAGAIAVAVAAAVASRIGMGESVAPETVLRAPLRYLPDGPTKSYLEKIAAVPLSADPHRVSAIFGNGSQVLSSDTVPFCLWCVARHSRSYEEAVFSVIDVGGDQDTTGAIVGGIVALSSSGPPEAWRDAREALPSLFA
jgi:ADP-ribosylglycohydrolase